MPITPENIELLHYIKQELGIDVRLGERLSKEVAKRGEANGISPITEKEGEELAEETFNPVIQDVIDNQEP